MPINFSKGLGAKPKIQRWVCGFCFLILRKTKN
ncbi:hypothetical protein LTSEBAI_1824, partial [Salmonella enterica subsp. enterica serovar Baildon str. R6-199]